MQKYRSSVSMLLSKVFLFFLLLFLIFSAVAFAAPGDGEGGGGGSSVPLRMDWSYPADGENNVSVTPIIQCKFSHNVAHNAVIEKNTALFSWQSWTEQRLMLMCMWQIFSWSLTNVSISTCSR